MLDAIEELETARPEIQSIVVVAPIKVIEEGLEIMLLHDFGLVKVIERQTREALAASDAAAITSGTATLEGTLLETPMVVVYKESKVNWNTLGKLVTVPHFGLVNLVAGREIAKELMQDELTGPNLAQEILKLLDPETNRAARKELRDVAQQVGPTRRIAKSRSSDSEVNSNLNHKDTKTQIKLSVFVSLWLALPLPSAISRPAPRGV